MASQTTTKTYELKVTKIQLTRTGSDVLASKVYTVEAENCQAVEKFFAGLFRNPGRITGNASQSNPLYCHPTRKRGLVFTGQIIGDQAFRFYPNDGYELKPE